MEEEKIKEEISKEILIEDKESWELARKIFNQNINWLKPTVTVGNIYNRIRELKKA